MRLAKIYRRQPSREGEIQTAAMARQTSERSSGPQKTALAPRKEYSQLPLFQTKLESSRKEGAYKNTANVLGWLGAAASSLHCRRAKEGTSGDCLRNIRRRVDMRVGGSAALALSPILGAPKRLYKWPEVFELMLFEPRSGGLDDHITKVVSRQFRTHFELCNRAVNCCSSRRTASSIAGVGAASAPSTSVAKPLNVAFSSANWPAAASSPCCFAAW